MIERIRALRNYLYVRASVVVSEPIGSPLQQMCGMAHNSDPSLPTSNLTSISKCLKNEVIGKFIRAGSVRAHPLKPTKVPSRSRAGRLNWFYPSVLSALGAVAGSRAYA